MLGHAIKINHRNSLNAIKFTDEALIAFNQIRSDHDYGDFSH
jgi:hypothetical protein